MSLSVSYKRTPHYLIVEFAPSMAFWRLDNMKRVVDLVNRQCHELGYERVLLDLTPVAGEPAYLDRFRIGVYIAEVMPGRPRFAVLARHQSINKFGEDTAVNRGAVMLVTHDRIEAITWLLETLNPGGKQ
jgi:hypothetical protein